MKGIYEVTFCFSCVVTTILISHFLEFEGAGFEIAQLVDTQTILREQDSQPLSPHVDTFKFKHAHEIVCLEDCLKSCASLRPVLLSLQGT